MNYGKRPLWHWIVLYLIIGGIIYGLIYYFVIAKQGGYSYSPANYNYNYTSSNPTTSTTPTMSKNEVTVTANGFAPQSLTIKTGETVTWTNKSGAGVAINSAIHPTHLVYPPLNLDKVADGASVSLMFPTAGTYKYHNHLNASQSGSIVVQ